MNQPHEPLANMVIGARKEPLSGIPHSFGCDIAAPCVNLPRLMKKVGPPGSTKKHLYYST